MPDPKLIADAGGWAAFVSLVALVLLGIRRGDFVPRFVYDREVGRGDKLEIQLDRNTETLGRLADELEWARRGGVAGGQRHG